MTKLMDQSTAMKAAMPPKPETGLLHGDCWRWTGIGWEAVAKGSSNDRPLPPRADVLAADLPGASTAWGPILERIETGLPIELHTVDRAVRNLVTAMGEPGENVAATCTRLLQNQRGALARLLDARREIIGEPA